MPEQNPSNYPWANWLCLPGSNNCGKLVIMLAIMTHNDNGYKNGIHKEHIKYYDWGF